MKPNRSIATWVQGFLLTILVLASSSGSDAKEFNPDNPINPPAPIFWCPDRTPDQQFAATPEPGCRPIVEKEDKKPKVDGKKEKKADTRPLIKIHEIQNEASKFAEKYRKFLDCCISNVDSIEDIDELQEEAIYILKSVQQKGIFNSTGFGVGPIGGGAGVNPKLGTFARQWTIGEIVRTVVSAQDNLRKLKQRLEKLDEAKENLDTLDYEASAHERRRIEAEEEAINKEFKSKKPPASARTGMEIGNSTLSPRIGGDIESTTLNNSFGADIGYTVSPYSDIREDLRPRRGTDIQDTTSPTRYGPSIQDTTLPNRFGFGAGTTTDAPSTLPSKAGPAIGDSSLNQR